MFFPVSTRRYYPTFRHRGPISISLNQMTHKVPVSHPVVTGRLEEPHGPSKKFTSNHLRPLTSGGTDWHLEPMSKVPIFDLLKSG